LSERRGTLTLKWRQVNAWRLSQHCLSQRLAHRNFVEAATRIGGVQAQVMSAAEMALGARVDGLAPRDVQSALWRERTLVKTWLMRGTLHLVPAVELPLYVAARAAHEASSAHKAPRWAKYFAHFGIKAAQYEAFIACIPQILGAEPMTREQLAMAAAKQIRAPKLARLLASSSWGSLWKPSAWRGELCFGPNLGRNVTFVNPARWIGERAPLDPHSALRQIARRYLRAYGPATAKDFALWWGFGLAPARKIFQSMEDEIETVEVEGWQAYALRETLEPMRRLETTGLVNLLPLFDAYVMGIGRGAAIAALLPRQYQARVLRPQGWISAVVLADGYLKGVWSLENRGRKAIASVRMFSPPARPVRTRLEAEVERLGAFLDTEILLKL